MSTLTAERAVPTMRLVPRPAGSLQAGRHPLATRTGIELLGLILAASEHWQPLTRKQRAALRWAYRAAMDAVPADIPAEGVAVELPSFRADVHPSTVRSLERRGLAAQGRLTVLGAQVVQHGDHDRRRAVTVRTVGGLL